MANKRIFYFDALRVFAILCVVLLHVTGHLGELMNYNLTTIYSFTGVYELFATNFFRIGIALFLMLSGALLLGRDEDIKTFYSKRLVRIVKPFLFWSLIFTAVLVLSSYLVSSIDFVSQFGIYDILKVFADTLMCRAPGSAVYWFFWMMFAVYILMPFVNNCVKKADMSQIEYFLIIWALYLFAVYSLMIPIPEVLSFIICPIGFVVLGYYLRNTQRRLFNSVPVSIVLIIIPTVLMLIYSFSVLNTSILFVFHRYSIPVMIEAVGVFCLFKSLNMDSLSSTLKSYVSSIAMASYGMYLIHSQIIMVVRKIFPLSHDFTLTYITLFAAGFFLSWAIIIALSKIPFISDFIGFK